MARINVKDNTVTQKDSLDYAQEIQALAPTKQFFISVQTVAFKIISVQYDDANLSAAEKTAIQTYLTGKGLS